MESNKVKELKDDALLNVKVNKTYYMMCKAALYTVFKVLYDSSGNPDVFVKKIVTKEYKEMDDTERLFYTLSLLVGEIEKQGLETKSFVEKEVDIETLKKDLTEKFKKTNED
jgi:hypothetical protein